MIYREDFNQFPSTNNIFKVNGKEYLADASSMFSDDHLMKYTVELDYSRHQLTTHCSPYLDLKDILM